MLINRLGGGGEKLTEEINANAEKVDTLLGKMNGKGTFSDVGKFVWYKYDSEGGNYIETVVSNNSTTYPDGAGADGYFYEKQFPGEQAWLTAEDGTLIAPLFRQTEVVEMPTAEAPQIAATYTGFTADGLVEGEGNIVKKLIYATAITRFDAGNGRHYADIQLGTFGISKLSTIHAVANGTDGTKVGLTITLKKDDSPLGYIITTFSTDDASPVQTEHTITNGVLRLEAFGAQYTKINYLVLEEN